MDRYAYVNNSPIRYNDPSGHLPDSWISKFLGIKEERLKTWREKNQQNLNYYNMLASAQAGDILRIKTQYKNSDGSTSYQTNNYYVMETTDGDYGLFRLEDKQMVFTGSSSEDEATSDASVIVGYAIGKDDDYDNVFNFSPSDQVETSQYTLMPGWGNEHVKFDLEINYRRLTIDLALTFGPPITMLILGALDIAPLTKGALILGGVTTLGGAVDTANTLLDSKYRYVYKK